MMLYKIGFETFNGSITFVCSPPLLRYLKAVGYFS